MPDPVTRLNAALEGSVYLVTNWFTELRERMGEGN